ncbi:MAG: hypothetical protein MZW92_08125 [Comamonadaceae bacterium]|nr:hypothetical protein [Comamonadaceae bacterium]
MAKVTMSDAESVSIPDEPATLIVSKTRLGALAPGPRHRPAPASPTSSGDCLLALHAVTAPSGR